jgi:hypothetical protein
MQATKIKIGDEYAIGLGSRFDSVVRGRVTNKRSGGIYDRATTYVDFEILDELTGEPVVRDDRRATGQRAVKGVVGPWLEHAAEVQERRRQNDEDYQLRQANYKRLKMALDVLGLPDNSMHWSHVEGLTTASIGLLDLEALAQRHVTRPS